jgi:C-terminal processing protease CtpA/Prc
VRGGEVRQRAGGGSADAGAGEVRQGTIGVVRPDGSVAQRRVILGASEGRFTFEGAGLVLAGVTVSSQSDDGTMSVTFRDAPVVESVVAGGLAERGGIRAGDRVIGVSTDVPLAPDLQVLTGSGTVSLTETRGIGALASAGPGRPVVLTILRDGVQRQLILQMN